jgi:spermidine synthase/MFS family permease
MSRVPRSALYAAFLLSGLTALVYQVIWSRYLTLLVGGTSVAHTIVLATFMAGLAFGNAYFGRLADRPTTNRLRLYALLEVGIGLACVLFPQLFDSISRAYLALASVSGPGASINHVLKVLLAAASMFVPCVFMGGTLPLLAKYVVDSMSGFGVRLGFLYFINTAGAVAGCIVGGFYVVEAWGLEAGMVAAALLNVAIGGIFYFWSKRVPAQAEAIPAADAATEPEAAAAPETVSEPAAAFTYTAAQASAAFWCIAIAGSISMLYELAWTRVLAMSIGGTVHSFSTMLISFISGIAIGSALAGRVLRQPRNALALFGLCEIGIALSILVPLHYYERLPYAFHRVGSWLSHAPETYWLYLLLQVLLAAAVMLVPTTLIGAALPLASRVCVERLEVVGRRVGSVFSVNTIGTVVGAVLTGFFLLPWLGIHRTLLLGCAVSALLGVVLLWAWRPRPGGSPGRALTEAVSPAPSAQGPALWPAAAAVAGAAFLGAVIAPRWEPRLMQQALFRWSRDGGFTSWEQFRTHALGSSFLYVRDGADGTVAVQQRNPTNLAIRVNGKPDASTVSDMPTQLMVGHLPMLLHPDPKTAMVVGLGSGATASAVLHHPGVTADVAEISPEMVEAARFFDAWTARVLDNPRMSLHVLDAREFLLLTRKRYDVIVSEPTNIWIPGVANLFTSDFYRVVHSRLNPGGIFAQWMQSYSADSAMVASVVASVSGEFPYVSAWLVSETDLILVAADERPPFAPDRFAQRLAALRPTFDVPLEKKPGPLGLFMDPVLFLSHQVGAHEAVALAWPRGTAGTYHDKRPQLEFQAARAQFRSASYAIRDHLDARVTRLGTEPLFLEEYLARHPLDAAGRVRLGRQFDDLGGGFRHLRAAIASDLVRGGLEDPSAMLALSEALLSRIMLARRFGERIDAGGAGGPQLCEAYIAAEHGVLRDSRSVFGRMPVDAFEARALRCMEARPDASRQFRAMTAMALADAGATEPALRWIRQLTTDGTVAAMNGPDAATLLAAGAVLVLESGSYERALAWANRALERDSRNTAAARIVLAARARGVEAKATVANALD